jgi:hypothetical protein
MPCAKDFGPQQREVFVLRLWRSGSEDSVWRIEVEHVATSIFARLSDLSDLPTYIESQLSQGSQTPPTE